MKVLVLGASGMLGNAVLRFFDGSKGFDALGTVRSTRAARLLPSTMQERLILNVDVENMDSLLFAFGQVKPDLVINCVGLVKQVSAANDPLSTIPINSLLPHRLARLCAVSDSRFVHISTDCVFAGTKGMYTEDDAPDAKDLYGRSKLLGEVDLPNAITLRTSIIGPELASAHGLISWFLGQEGAVNGFKRAIFSGLPTVELARVIRDHVIPHPELRGLYHVSSAPISKFDLLVLVAEAYAKTIEIKPDQLFSIDRSLDSTRFQKATNFHPKSWRELVRSMKEFG